MTMSLILMTMVLAGDGCRATSSAISEEPKLIESHTWRLARLRGAEVLETSGITMELAPDGKAFGSTGVNSYRGTYTINASGKIDFSPFAVTRRAGPPEAMRREADFLTALERVRRYRTPDGNSFVLLDESDEVQLVWRR
jgi:heat shock protein HslJ